MDLGDEVVVQSTVPTGHDKLMGRSRGPSLAQECPLAFWSPEGRWAEGILCSGPRLPWTGGAGPGEVGAGAETSERGLACWEF